MTYNNDEFTKFMDDWQESMNTPSYINGAKKLASKKKKSTGGFRKTDGYEMIDQIDLYLGACDSKSPTDGENAVIEYNDEHYKECVVLLDEVMTYFQHGGDDTTEEFLVRYKNLKGGK